MFDGTSLAREYIAAAGGPASGKSTLLEGISENRNCPPGFVNNFKRVYIDPDRSCMVNMERTYLADLKSGMSSMDAYTKWRNASNFLSNVFLARALNEGYAIAHGTTLATPPSMKALQAIQNHYHYKTTLFSIIEPEIITCIAPSAKKLCVVQGHQLVIHENPSAQLSHESSSTVYNITSLPAQCTLLTPELLLCAYGTNLQCCNLSTLQISPVADIYDPEAKMLRPDVLKTLIAMWKLPRD